MSLQEAKQFVAQFIKGDYTPEEYAAFLRWLRGATMDELDEIADVHESMDGQWAELATLPSADWVSQMEEKLDRIREQDRGLLRRFAPGHWAGRKAWVAAASVVVLLSSGVYVFVREKWQTSDVGKESVKLAMNSYTNPRGGDQKELILEDGSKVWLNAASTLKYPGKFEGSERVVELSGEAFFEVTKNSDKPFRVKIKDAEVEVLGTHFNVMAYEEEKISKTTLIDGSVRVESGARSVVLHPNEQAVIPYPSAGVSPEITVVRGVNPDAALAWKSGSFQFDNDDLKTVMMQISRAYDVDIQLDPNVPAKHVTGAFPRQPTVNATLKLLENIKSLQIHFQNDGKIIRVTL